MWALEEARIGAFDAENGHRGGCIDDWARAVRRRAVSK
jgi:hypothetical protein